MMGAIMSKYEKYVICLIVVAVSVWVGRQWLVAHDDLKKAEATISVNEATHKQEVATLQAQLSVIASQVKAANTPAKRVEVATKLLPSLPAPLIVGQATKEEPIPPVIIPAVDQQPLLQIIGDCAECKLKLASSEAQVAELTKERDVALKAAKGGGFWRRVGTAAKYVGIGAVIGASLAKF